jgi:uncharacterized DUF497 family protein
VPTVVDGEYEWDEAKARSNLLKHGVTFEEAKTVFTDDQALYLADASDAERFIAIGTSVRGRGLFVVHVERGTRERIISARKANAQEIRAYESKG